MKQLLISFVAFLPLFTEAQWTDPEPLAANAATRAIEAMGQATPTAYRNFDKWSYEGGGILRGLWEIQHQFPSSVDIEPFLHDHLNYFQTEPKEFGYRILNGESLDNDGKTRIRPYFFTIGDHLCLFPIAYADRLRYATDLDAFSSDDDLFIIRETVEEYVYGFPYHLPDGTISRPLTWPEEGRFDNRGQALWVDDSFMGNALALDLGMLTGEQEHVLEAARQGLSIYNYLNVDSDGLLHHGSNEASGHTSCCKWGRGNGWSVMANSETLLAMEQMGLEGDDLFSDLKEAFLEQTRALAGVQSGDGRWHNILDDDSTYLETSATAMYLIGLVRGVRSGWFESEEEATAMLETSRLAWNSLVNQIRSDGSVEGIQPGTGIKDDPAGYEPDNTDYENSSPGLGSVLRATAAVGGLLGELNSK